MIYQLHALVRLPALTRAQFLHHWTQHHAPLVKSLAADLRIRSYDQMHVADLAAVPPGPFDGFAIVGFKDFEDFQAMLASPEGRAAARRVREDERAFFDRQASPVSWTLEVPIF
jgi:uncharacterized protein (TIGR02118 family)